jgi:hypothetical protein
MFKPSKFALILGLAGAMAGLPCLAAAQQDPDADAAAVAEAIRYEKAKQAAADRQLRIEEGREHGVKPANGSVSESKPKPRPVKSAVAQKAPPPPRDSQ